MGRACRVHQHNLNFVPSTRIPFRRVTLACLVSLLHAQNVGIGTATPLSRLHVHGAPPADANSGQLRISESVGGGYLLIGRAATYGFIQSHNAHPLTLNPLGNNVGIGTAAPHPGARLHVVGSGTQGVLLPSVALTAATNWAPVAGAPQNGMLVYNTATAGTGANAVRPGYYYWQAGRWRRFTENGYAGMVQGVLYNQQQQLTTVAYNWQYMNAYITLPPGRWIVFSTQLLSVNAYLPTNASIWVRTTFSDCSSWCGYSPDIVGSYLISGILPPQCMYSLITGQVIINNPGPGPKTYYYYGHKAPYNTQADPINIATTLWGENQLFALPAE